VNAPLINQPLTPEDLLAMPEANGYELVDGQVVEKNVSILSSIVGTLLSGLLAAHCLAKGLGWVVHADCGFQCFPDHPKKVRKPDVGFVRRERLPSQELRQGNCPIHPDLAVEVVSPKDLFDEVDLKVEEYLRVGVPLVWVVSLETRIVYVHRGDGSLAKVREDGELDGEDVVPGFRCRVRDIFPPLETPQATNPAS
jgi:Uma2 family endonuclease